ncbi:hypothetical protein GQ53DRAFT_769172 [Thozetella sp. PMI_491]|nr:hypothetical protein GQ53DRAFT_769172 [Thozetella sp. PMI_491]
MAVRLPRGLLEKAKEIHSSATGSTEADRTLRQVTRDLQRVSLGLKTSQSSAGAQDPETEALVDICSDCEDLAEELLGILNDVQAKDPSSKRQSIKAAVKRLWKAKEIEELQARLDLLGRALDQKTQLVFRTEIRDKLSQIIESGKTQHLDIAELQKSVKAVRDCVTAASFSSDAVTQLKDLISLSDEAVLRARQQVILDALRFDEINDRIQDVNEAHKETFEWILKARRPDDPQLDSPRKELAMDTLRQWLSGDKSILHVLGKPGSGKSTLMKFLFEHPRVSHELEIWAGDKRLVMVSFFFWRSGSRLQRATEGLIRGLLYSVLEQLPSLISTTFPTEWARTDPTGPGSTTLTLQTTLSLERAKIFEAFEALISNPEVMGSHRFVFFVDGLDEFEPDGHRATHLDLVQSLKTWCRKQPGSIKICVSSREYPVFEAEFAQFARLRLQDLTLGDMQIVAKDFLQSALIAQLELTRDDLAHLEWQLVSKSDGVFLWLTLVIRNLEPSWFYLTP